jgi:hypothetical protein
MQLWGENRTGVDTTIRPEDLERIRTTKPTAIALYGLDLEQLNAYARTWASDLTKADLTCSMIDWPTMPGQVYVCIAPVE